MSIVDVFIACDNVDKLCEFIVYQDGQFKHYPTFEDIPFETRAIRNVAAFRVLADNLLKIYLAEEEVE